MYSNSQIRQTLKELIDKGINKFVIFPYGDNGMLIKTILQENFNLSPQFIVDNVLCLYNENILSIGQFRGKYDSSMHVILCIENQNTNKKLHEMLLKFVDPANITNLTKSDNTIAELRSRVERSVFSLENILPASVNIQRLKDLEKKEKIKVRILHSAYNFWNTAESICKAFESDDRYDIKVILAEDSGNLEKRIEQMKLYSHEYIIESEYIVEHDCPDILLIPFRSTVSSGKKTPVLEKIYYFKLVVVICSQTVRYGMETKLLNVLQTRYGEYKPDVYLIDPYLFSEVVSESKNGINCIEMPSAKFDGIYRATREKRYLPGWNKIKGKKVILWATTHGVVEDLVTFAVTFDLYAKTIFEFAENNEEIAVIIRLAEPFIDEMLKYRYWSIEDVWALKKYCLDSRNIIWDDSDNYENSFSVADAVLTDGFCGIIYSALPILKPICAMYRNDVEFETCHQDIIDNLYTAYSEKDIESFMQLVKNGEDPMYDMRKAFKDKYIYQFDGKNGIRAKECVEKIYLDKISVKALED